MVSEVDGDGFVEVDVHSGNPAVGGHDGVEFFGVLSPRGDNSCRVVGEGPNLGGVHFLVHDPK